MSARVSEHVGRLAPPPTGSEGGDAGRTLVSWPALFALAVFLSAAFSTTVLVDGDSYWHVAAGRWILEHRRVPTADVFSHARPGIPWTAYEWGSEVALYSAYAAGGWRGVQLLAAAAYAFVAAYMLRFLLARMEVIYALFVGGISAALMYGHFLARPHVLAWPLTAVWVATLVRAVEERRPPPWPLVALMAVWANMHGSFLLGGGIAALLAIEALLLAADDAGRLKALAMRWGAFLVASAGAVLLNPRGAHLVGHVLAITRLETTLAVLDEWKPTDLRTPSVFAVWFFLVLAIALSGRLALRLPRTLVMLALVYLAFKHQRHQAQVGIVSPFLIATSLGVGLAAGRRNARSQDGLDRLLASLARPIRRAGIVGMALAVIVIVGAGRKRIPDRPAPRITPDAALAAVRAARIDGPVLNDYSLGGYLIFHGIPVLIDGRGDMYPEPYMAEIDSALNHPDRGTLPRVLQQYRIGWSLLSPGSPAVRALDSLPGWRRLHADSAAVVHVPVSR